MRTFQITCAFTLLVGAFAQLPWPKRGLPFNDETLIVNFNGGGSQVNWAYNWDSQMNDPFPDYLEFIPMLWSAEEDHTSVWFDNAQIALDAGSGHLLAFNEPDNPAQSNMDPGYAAQMYMQYMMPFVGKAALGAPAVCNGPAGITWITSFLSACESLGCQIDFVPFHWYDDASNVQYFYDYFGDAMKAAQGRQVWITEFEAYGSPQDQINFMNTILPWLDQEDQIYRYAWFGAQAGSLVNTDASLTNVGGMYMGDSY